MEYDDLLDDNLSSENRYAILPDASKGQRFANYLLDLVAMVAGMFVLGIALAVLAPHSGIFDSWLFSEDNPISDYVLNALMILIYYPLTEGLLKGKSLGKFITRTRAVRQDGSEITMQDVFMRSLSRLVPFEHFSFLGSTDRGWHDKWTDTRVVNEKNVGPGVY